MIIGLWPHKMSLINLKEIMYGTCPPRDHQVIGTKWVFRNKLD